MEKPPKTSPSSEKPTSWIFIRGMARAAAHWGTYPKQFERLVPGAKAFCLDIPGNGKLYDKKSPLTIASMTDYLRQTYRESVSVEWLSLPTFLVGMSMGGMIVIDWLDRYPDDLQGAITINTSASEVSPIYRRLNPIALGSFLNIGITRNPRAKEKLILELTAEHKVRREAALDSWSNLASSAPVNLRNTARQLLAAARFQLPRTAPRKPLLMLNSAKDRIAHPSCSRKIAERWKVSLKTHPYAGHNLPIDDPDWITQSIQEWRANAGL